MENGDCSEPANRALGPCPRPSPKLPLPRGVSISVSFAHVPAALSLAGLPLTSSSPRCSFLRLCFLIPPGNGRFHWGMWRTDLNLRQSPTPGFLPGSLAPGVQGGARLSPKKSAWFASLRNWFSLSKQGSRRCSVASVPKETRWGQPLYLLSFHGPFSL